jgi:hypothetical protein
VAINSKNLASFGQIFKLTNHKTLFQQNGSVCMDYKCKAQSIKPKFSKKIKKEKKKRWQQEKGVCNVTLSYDKS